MFSLMSYIATLIYCIRFILVSTFNTCCCVVKLPILGGQKLKNCVSYNMEGRKYQFLIKFRSFFAFILFNFIAWFSCLGCSNLYFRNLFFNLRNAMITWQRATLKDKKIQLLQKKIESFHSPRQTCHRQTVYLDKMCQ